MSRDKNTSLDVPLEDSGRSTDPAGATPSVRLRPNAAAQTPQVLRFFEFSQNNSGGSFVKDNDLTHRLFIEATDAKKANAVAQGLGVYFNGCDSGRDCPCCGDRWYPVYDSDAIDLKKMSESWKMDFPTIESYALHLATNYGWCSPDARIFYNDGRVYEVFKPARP